VDAPRRVNLPRSPARLAGQPPRDIGLRPIVAREGRVPNDGTPFTICYARAKIFRVQSE